MVNALPQKPTERDDLVTRYLPLVRSIAVRIRESLPRHVELDDLHQAGILGLIDAAAKFNTDRNVSFENYARFRIRGAIIDSLREADWVSREERRRYKQLDTATHQLKCELGRDPSEEERAAYLNLTIAAVDSIAKIETDGDRRM